MMPAPKQPQDHKKSKAERENEPFEWEHDGKTFTLPPATKIKAGVLRRAAKAQGGEIEQIFTLFEAVTDEDTIAVMEDMDIGDLNAMFEAWQKHSGASLGESSGSSS